MEMENLSARNFMKGAYERPDSYNAARPSESYNKLVLAKLELGRNSKVLDLGSGSGNEADFFREKTPGSVFESDFSMSGFDRGGLPGNFVLSDAENQPFTDGAFSLVHCKDMIVHIPNKKKIFDEVYRLLKDTGKFLLTTELSGEDKNLFYFRVKLPNYQGSFNQRIFFANDADYLPLVEQVKQTYGSMGEVVVSPPFYFASEQEIERQCADSGLIVEKKFYWQPGENEENWSKDKRVVYEFTKSKKE